MSDNGNPFDRPLDSELDEHQRQQATTLAKSSNGNPVDEPLISEKLEAKVAQAGTITNDVGNTAIVPKDGESFADTMKRAAAYGKTITQDQINKELARHRRRLQQCLPLHLQLVLLARLRWLHQVKQSAVVED